MSINWFVADFRRKYHFILIFELTTYQCKLQLGTPSPVKWEMKKLTFLSKTPKKLALCQKIYWMEIMRKIKCRWETSIYAWTILILFSILLQTFANKLYKPAAFLMPIFVALSCAGGMNGNLLTTSRIFFVSAREGHLPHIMAGVSTQFLTPLPAVLIMVKSLKSALTIIFIKSLK